MSSVSTVYSSQKDHFLKVLKLTDSLLFSSRWKPLQKSIQNLSTVEMAAVNMREQQLPRNAVWKQYKMADERR